MSSPKLCVDCRYHDNSQCHHPNLISVVCGKISPRSCREMRHSDFYCEYRGSWYEKKNGEKEIKIAEPEIKPTFWARVLNIFK